MAADCASHLIMDTTRLCNATYMLVNTISSDPTGWVLAASWFT